MISRLVSALAVIAIVIPLAGAAGNLTLPSRARLLGDTVNPLDSYALPLGVFANGTIPVRVLEGQITRQSWRLDGAVDSTLQILTPLRDQLTAAGFDILLECRDDACGGFDFRFATDVIPAPDMHVNVRDYRFLSAMRGDDEALSLLISRTRSAVFVQMVHVSPPDGMRVSITPSPISDAQGLLARQNEIAETLTSQGHVVLGDLVFETGAAKLGPGPFGSLRQLAGFMAGNPGYRIVLVGHTDNVGSLKDNITLSERRAGAVRKRLIEQLDVAPARIDAKGIGYLAPIASNLTPEGRRVNRRVEVILLAK